MPPTRSLSPPAFLNHVVSSRLCVRCRIFSTALMRKFSKNYDVLRQQLEHYDFKTLRISASRGCSMCRFMFHELAPNIRSEDGDPRLDVTLKISFNYSSTIDADQSLVYTPILTLQTIDVIDFSLKSKTFEFFELRGGDSTPNIALPHRSRTNMRDVHSHPMSTSCWKIVEGWISSCVKNHEVCKQPTTELMPKRLIDVSYERPTLVDTSTNHIVAPYVALSHCWGQGHHPLSHTRTSTLNDFYNGIDISDFPKTFRDATEVTRRLGIRYLWIDSLCIIQDSKVDWEEEAKKMGTYYQNCFLNISALDAPESDTGFLRPRPVTSTVHLSGDTYLRPASRSWSEVFRSSPLSRRAWVLQERLVCTRVLHFGRDDMFWECLTCSTRESNITEHFSADRNAEWADEDFKRSLLFSENNRVEDAITKWYRVVTQYSALLMSYESDMLPAISAIAKRIQAATSYRYIAGMWEEDLHFGLLWRAEGSKIQAKFWRAPSWSWAQLTGPVHHIAGASARGSREADPYDLQILEVDVTPAFEDPSIRPLPFRSLEDGDITISRAKDALDSISGAHLRVDGYVTPVWIKGSHGNPPYNNPSLKLILDVFTPQGLPIGTGYLDMLGSNASTRSCIALGVSVYRDFKTRFEIPDSSEVPQPILYFLLIEEVPEGEEIEMLLLPREVKVKQYRRIGIGQTFDPFEGRYFDKDIFGDAGKEELILI